LSYAVQQACGTRGGTICGMCLQCSVMFDILHSIANTHRLL
jgi:hypothetical protein